MGLSNRFPLSLDRLKILIGAVQQLLPELLILVSATRHQGHEWEDIMQDSQMRLSIYTDGASRGNPGSAAWAYVVVRDGGIIRKRSGYLGYATNNTAEYHAIINALADLSQTTREPIEIISDSELVVRQINGDYRVRKEHLAKLHRKVLAQAAHFEDVRFASVPRGNRYIQVADQLCNEILDSHMRQSG